MSTYSTQIPGAPGYAGAAALAQKAYANAMSRYQQQRGNTLLKYGYQKNADGSYGVDANNEYGQYQSTLRNEAGQTEHLQRAQAGSGWGDSSGYLGAQRDNLNLAQGGEQAAVGQGLQSELDQVTQGEQQASYDQDAALYQAQQQAAEAALQGQQFDPTDYSGIDQPAYGQPAAPVKAAPLRKATPAVHQAGKAKLLAAAKKKKTVKKGGR